MPSPLYYRRIIMADEEVKKPEKTKEEKREEFIKNLNKE